MSDDKDHAARLRETRIEYVADLMRDLKFATGKTTKALAREWGMSYSAAVAITSEASKRVRAELTDSDHVLSKVSSALDKTITEAMATGDYRAVVQAAKIYADVTGATSPTKVQVLGDLSALSAEQLAARKDELIRRLTQKDEK